MSSSGMNGSPMSVLAIDMTSAGKRRSNDWTSFSMTKARFVIAGTVVYAAITFPLAYAWHLVTFADVYDGLHAFTRAEPIVAFGFIAIVLQGVLLSSLYAVFPRTGRPLLDDVRFGLICGVLLWSSQVLAAAAKHELTSLRTWFAIETAYFAIQFALVGAAFGLIRARAMSDTVADSSVRATR